MILFKLTTGKAKIVDIVLNFNILSSFKPLQGLGGTTQYTLIFCQIYAITKITARLVNWGTP